MYYVICVKLNPEHNQEMCGCINKAFESFSEADDYACKLNTKVGESGQGWVVVS